MPAFLYLMSAMPSLSLHVFMLVATDLANLTRKWVRLQTLSYTTRVNLAPVVLLRNQSTKPYSGGSLALQPGIKAQITSSSGLLKFITWISIIIAGWRSAKNKSNPQLSPTWSLAVFRACSVRDLPDWNWTNAKAAPMWVLTQDSDVNWLRARV